jgi:hypothetical protein
MQNTFCDYKERTLRIRTALFWVITQRAVVISYQCFRTTSGFENSNFGTLRMGLIGCSATPVRNHHSHCIIAQENSSQLLCGGSLKSCIDRGCSRMGAEENRGQEKTE